MVIGESMPLVGACIKPRDRDCGRRDHGQHARSCLRRDATAFRVADLALEPRVAHSSQPWAEGFNPFGIVVRHRWEGCDRFGIVGREQVADAEKETKGWFRKSCTAFGQLRPTIM